ncbi:hypothetical protein F5B18DRAFT_422169 [Nemania serpens]|nr:hypothetical protein F5B18DRAFT_422169 [Nemania serpens]
MYVLLSMYISIFVVCVCECVSINPSIPLAFLSPFDISPPASLPLLTCIDLLRCLLTYLPTYVRTYLPTYPPTLYQFVLIIRCLPSPALHSPPSPVHTYIYKSIRTYRPTPGNRVVQIDESKQGLSKRE